MHTYLVQTEFASKMLISLIHEESNYLNELQIKQSDLQQRYQELYQQFLGQDLDLDGNYSDAQIMRSYATQYKYYESMVLPLNIKIQDVQLSIAIKEESIKALCGALLQIAKQGISIVHQGLGNAPNGRIIKGQPLKNIIWQARNQSMHFEDGRYRQGVIDCFQLLNIPLSNTNLAKEIINLLEWDCYEAYIADMVQILIEGED